MEDSKATMYTNWGDGILAPNELVTFAPPQWEYYFYEYVAPMNKISNDVKDMFKQLGAAGWELTVEHVLSETRWEESYRAIFKRQKVTT